MKETIKINLSGLLFDLDNDAYERLRSYLDSIKAKFNAKGNEGEEILEDIEARIAEILQEKVTDSKQVITLADIDEIIAILGTADEMDSDDEEESSQSASSSRTYQRTNKRFYRDPQNSILGGVSSGIAAYFNIDPLWIRLLFVLLFFANLAGLVIYVILWFVLPPARTTGQRLEMQGKKVTLNDIEGSVRNEYEKVKTSVKNIPNSKVYKDAEGTLSEIGSVLGRILVVFLKVILAIIGISILISIVTAILGVVIGGAVFMPWSIFENWHFPDFLQWTNISLFGVCLFIVIVLPIIALISKLIRLLAGVKHNNRVPAVIGATIWVIAFISLIVLIVVEGERGLFRSAETHTHDLKLNENKALYIRLNEYKYDSDEFENYQIFNFRFGYNEYEDDFYKRPELQITSTPGNRAVLHVNHSYVDFSVGRIPDHYSDYLNYSWHLEDSVLYFDEYYVCDDDDAWRMPYLTLNLELPEGQEVYFDDEIQKLLNDFYRSDEPYTMKGGALLPLN